MKAGGVGKLSWYWHRLRAMSPGEMLGHARKKLRQSADARGRGWPSVDLSAAGSFPRLPAAAEAPAVVRDALRSDVDALLAGRWRYFGHLDVSMPDPPRWQWDALAGRDVTSDVSAFRLNYRSLQGGVDSKLVWEPSRWSQLVRLAMAAHVLGDDRAGRKCLDWLEDWVRCNPAYRGWNWTSALEVGIRLIQFVWIDALLESWQRGAKARGVDAGTSLARLREAILPAHVWYAWRHQSFGSSANNHLLGELVGCLVAMARWPGLAACGASIEILQARWEREVLAQFAPDGGNREQALNYQLFSWEFCWQARMALMAAGRVVSPAVDERLRRAAEFFVGVQVPSDPWDYGDSDSAFVTPFFADDRRVTAEWHAWFSGLAKAASAEGSSLDYWLGAERRRWEAGLGSASTGVGHQGAGPWSWWGDSGQGMGRAGAWQVRWDGSPLGLGAMAAHGHLDALHLSIWRDGVALVVDPGTGAYHADKPLRNWLAGREAHNGPAVSAVGPWADEVLARRLGPFLWAAHHAQPEVGARADRKGWALGVLPLRRAMISREVGWERDGAELVVEDRVGVRGSGLEMPEFVVRWQFAPGTQVERLGERRYRVGRRGVTIEVQVSPDWAEVICVTSQAQVAQADAEFPLAGSVSPAFRQVAWAPYLKLVARPRGDKPCVFATTFLASAHSGT